MGLVLPETVCRLSLLLVLGIAACQGSSSNDSPGPPPELEAYDPVADRWTAGPRMPVRLQRAKCVGVGGMVYVLGGFEQSSFQGSDWAFRYDPVQRSWSELPGMTIGRFDHDAVAIGTDVYVTGGRRGAGSSVERFDTVAGVWTTEPDMPNVHEFCRSVSLGGSVYAFGSFSSPWPMDAFDSVSGAWQMVTTLPTAAYGAAAETDGSVIYVFAGGTSSRVWIYDPVLDAWTDGPPAPQHSLEFDSAIIGQEVYLVGEFRENRRQLFILDLVTRTWTEAAPRRGNRRYACAASENGLLYSIGGR